MGPSCKTLLQLDDSFFTQTFRMLLELCSPCMLITWHIYRSRPQKSQMTSYNRHSFMQEIAICDQKVTKALGQSFNQPHMLELAKMLADTTTITEDKHTSHKHASNFNLLRTQKRNALSRKMLINVACREPKPFIHPRIIPMSH